MTTAAPISFAWIPEDDLLLKNAVEAGASLEALAKGAVQFSRRYTFQELQDRWYSLLYDPDISAQASARMSELELSGFNPLTKSNRSDQIKSIKEIPQKRKLGSIRKQYYSMRKKFRSDFFNSNDLNFLDEPGLHGRSGHGADYQDNLKFHDAEIEILRSAFLTGCSNSVEEKHQNGILRKDGFAEGLSVPLRQGGRTSFDSVMRPGAISSFMEGTSGGLDEHSGVDESHIRQLQQLSVFDSSKEHPGSVFHGLRQGEHLSSPNGNSSFHTIGFPSPQPNLPLWETAEDFSATSLPVILKQADTPLDASKILTDSRNSRVEDSIPYNVIAAGALLGVRHNDPGMNNSSTVAECDDLSDSLLNLSNEDDILLIDEDGKDTSDKSYCDNLNSLLLSSPNDIPEDCNCKQEPEILIVSETCLADPKSADIETSEAVTQSTQVDHQLVHHPEVEAPSTSVLNPDSHALSDGTMLCTLNTEDPEIPCNDDIFLLIHPSTSFASSAPQPITRDSMDLSSAANQNQIGEVNLRTTDKDLVRSSSWSQKVGQNMLSEANPVHSLLGFGVKSELPDSDSSISLSGESNKALPNLSQPRSLHANPSILAVRKFEEDVARVELKTGETPAASMDPRNTEAGSSKMGLPEMIMNPSVSEEETQSDDDMPYFSDVEAMILEMDLDPHDQDSWNTKQASKYQYEDSRRTIIRLEQCAKSYMERTMTILGAFAIFYGRHLKHYMRKTEVILGRSTDDVDVDIDLRKEGHANKISRRQAIIKMEGDGSFHLKNLGKSLISVNGKSVATGRWLNLGLSCLIEIRGLSFIFETNQKYVKRYLSSISQQNAGKNNKFDWSPEVDI